MAACRVCSAEIPDGRKRCEAHRRKLTNALALGGMVSAQLGATVLLEAHLGLPALGLAGLWGLVWWRMRRNQKALIARQLEEVPGARLLTAGSEAPTAEPTRPRDLAREPE